MSESKPNKWIQSANIKKGALHRQLGIPADEKIPEDKLEAAAEKGGKLGARARLALTFRKMRSRQPKSET